MKATRIKQTASQIGIVASDHRTANPRKRAAVSLRRAQSGIEAHEWSDDYVAEHAYLVARGVRPMAIVGHVESNALVMLQAASRLAIATVYVPVIPFVVPRTDGFADCGFAAAAWILDLYEWLIQSDIVPKEHAHRIRGLLLGYSAEAIRAHDERNGGRRFTWSE